MTEDAANTTTSNQPEKRKIKCPCCGQFTLTAPAKPADDVLDHWLSCIMTGEPFHHTYPIYDGRLRVTIKNMSPELVSKLMRFSTAMEKLNEEDWGPVGCPVNIDQLMNMVRLYVSVSEIVVKTGTAEKVYAPADVISSIVDDALDFQLHTSKDTQLGDWVSTLINIYSKCTDLSLMSSTPIPLIRGIIDVHDKLTAVLMDYGFDETFWSGIELA